VSGRGIVGDEHCVAIIGVGRDGIVGGASKARVDDAPTVMSAVPAE
jgi:hypothetical protein